MNSKKLDYVLNTFKSVYDLPHIEDYIHYSVRPDKKPGISIVKSELALDFFENSSSLNIKNIKTAIWESREIPFLFNGIDQKNSEIITTSDNQVIINVDILAASFFLLSAWQEYSSDKLDSYGRFPYSESIQYSLAFSHIPLVNYYFDILKVAIEMFFKIEIKYKHHPDKNFSTFLTHDIDQINTIWMEDTFSSLKQFNIKNLLKSFLSLLKPVIKSSYIKRILDIEESCNVKSTFFFLPRTGSINGIRCADYSLSGRILKRIVLSLRKDGWGVSVHGSPGSEIDHIILAEDILSLKTNPIGNRFHFLLFNNRKSPAILENSGLKYDSSLGFSEEIGFRNSFCHPFLIYDIENDRSSGILEIPLNIMDTTIRRKGYLSNSTHGLDDIKSVVEEVKKFSGTLTILWHNNYFSGIKHKGFDKLYIEVIEYLLAANSEFITEEILKRRYLTIH